MAVSKVEEEGGEADDQDDHRWCSAHESEGEDSRPRHGLRDEAMVFDHRETSDEEWKAIQRVGPQAR